MHQLTKHTRALVALLCAGSGFYLPQAQGQGTRVNLSADGAYTKSFGSIKTSTRKQIGFELGIPVTSFFEISAGYTLQKQDSTRDGPDAPLEAQICEAQAAALGRTCQLPHNESLQSTETTVNGALSWSFGLVTPFVFGGKLWRRTCQEDSFIDYGCSSPQSTWNAGLGLSMLVSMRSRVRVKFQVSPASNEKKNAYDQTASLGVTLGI